MTNDDGRKPEGAPERSSKAGAGAPSGVDGNGPKIWTASWAAKLPIGHTRVRISRGGPRWNELVIKAVLLIAITQHLRPFRSLTRVHPKN
jgi:hypothetical protein